MLDGCVYKRGFHMFTVASRCSGVLDFQAVQRAVQTASLGRVDARHGTTALVKIGQCLGAHEAQPQALVCAQTHTSELRALMAKARRALGCTGRGACVQAVAREARAAKADRAAGAGASAHLRQGGGALAPVCGRVAAGGGDRAAAH